MQFHHATLANGLEVVAELGDEALSVATGFFVKTGSRDESLEAAGVSHFLEHMIFKGTETRDALAVNRDLDRIGAKHNAQTSEEDTIFHVTCLPEYLPRAFEILSDILRPSLRADDFETEKQVILEEIEMYQDNPMSVAYEHAKAAHFGDHPLGHSVLGTRESVGGLHIDQMRSYFRSRYGPANIVLAAAGNCDWSTILSLAETHCRAWGGENASRSARRARGMRGFEAIERSDDLQQSIIAVAEGPPLSSPDRYAAGILATILGDHTSSRLYWAMVDPGFADGAECSYQEYDEAGAFYTFLSCGPDEAQANVDRLAAIFGDLHRDGPSEAELARAKNKLMSRCVIRNERPFARLMSLGYYWAYCRRYVMLDEELAAYERVSLDDLRRVLKSYPLAPMSLVSVGPSIALQPPK